MTNSTPALMTVEQFNEAVSSWRDSSRRKIISNIRSNFTGRDKSSGYKKLSQSVTGRTGKNYGIANSIRFNFARHGVFLHYGVGRGYARIGNSVSRVRKNKSGTYDPVNAPTKRNPVDWFDVVIRMGIKDLADITQQFYGDEALREILNNFDKYLIEK